MIVGPIGNSQSILKKDLTSKMKISSQYSRPFFASLFGSSWTPLLLKYNPIVVPYGSNFKLFTGVKNNFRQIFNILNMINCKVLRQKIFQRQLKKVCIFTKIIPIDIRSIIILKFIFQFIFKTFFLLSTTVLV